MRQNNFPWVFSLKETNHAHYLRKRIQPWHTKGYFHGFGCVNASDCRQFAFSDETIHKCIKKYYKRTIVCHFTLGAKNEPFFFLMKESKWSTSPTLLPNHILSPLLARLCSKIKTRKRKLCAALNLLLRANQRLQTRSPVPCDSDEGIRRHLVLSQWRGVTFPVGVGCLAFSS